MTVVESLSYEELLSLFLRYSGYPNTKDDGIPIGETPPLNMPEATLEFIDFLVEEMEDRIEQVQPFSPQYAKCLDHRLVTFEEFEMLFSEAIDESEYIYHRAYDFYMIETYDQKRNLLSGIKRDYRGYMRLLQKSQASSIPFFFKPVEMRLPKDGLERHMHIMAKTGQGKSNLLKVIIHELQSEQKKQSIVVIEPHGDLAEELRDFALNIKDPERLIYIDPYYHKGYVPVINPFDIKDTSRQNIDRYAQELTKVFIELLKEGTKLSSQMDAVLRPAISTLLRVEGTTLEDLQDLMDSENPEVREKMVRHGMRNPYEAHRKMFARVWGAEDGEIPTTYKATLNSIFNKIQNLLNTEVFRNLTCANGGKSTIDIEASVEEGKVMLFGLSKGKMGEEASQAYGKFIVSMFQSLAFKRADQNEDDRMPTFMAIDEFQNYVTDSIKVILAEARKYKMHLILSHQSIGQISNTELRDTILGNTSIKAVGIASKKTLRVMAEEMGIKLTEFDELQPFEYYIDAQSPKTKVTAKPYRTRPPAHLAKWTSRYYQDSQERKAIREDQVKKYYAPIEGAANPIKQHTNEPKSDVVAESGAKPKYDL